MLLTPLSLSAWTAGLFMSAALFSHTVALRLLLLLLCTGLVLAAIIKDRTAVRLLPPVWLAFALWAAWAGLSLAWSTEPERTLKELRNEIGYTALGFWLCYVAAQARNAARIIGPVLAAATVLLCAIALYHFPQGYEPYQRGWHGGPGNFSSALLTLMPCAIVGAWYGHRAGWARAPLMSLGLVALFLLAAYTTLNRTIWFGFTVQLLVIGALLALRQRTLIAPRAKVIGAIVAVSIVAGAALMTSRIQAERVQNGAPTELSKDPRFTLWPEVLQHVKQRPLTGHGFGRGMLRQPLQNEFKQPLLWHAHNLLLETVVQVGVPGLLLLLLLLVATVREGWRMTQAPDDVTVACGVTVIAVVVGMLVRNMTDALWIRQNALLYWAVLGVLFAWGHRLRAPTGS